MVSTNQSTEKQWRIAACEELRIEILEGQRCLVRLISGYAEVFGSELGSESCFEGPCKFAVFTWCGAEIAVGRNVSSAYVGNNPSMKEFLNLHVQLHTLRKNAQHSLDEGPRVLVCGRSDSGKSSLCRILLSYARREREHSPIFVDLDVADAGFSVPGTFSAYQYSSESPSTCNGVCPVQPLIQWYGHESYRADSEYFKAVLEQFAMKVNRRLQTLRNETKYSGAIINTGAWADETGLELIATVVRIFRVNLIVIMEDDRLFSRIQQNIELSNVALMKVLRPPGVVEKNFEYRREIRNASIKGYFYGCVGNISLSPILRTVSWNAIKIVSVGSSKINVELLPVGQTSVLGTSTPEEIIITKDLLDCILGIVRKVKEKNASYSSCVGFCNVQKVDVEKKTMELLMPMELHLDDTIVFLLGGGLKWTE